MKKNVKSNVVAALVIVVVVLIALFLMKGSIYRMVVKYEDAGGRKSYEVKDSNLAAYINQNLPNDESLAQHITIEYIIDLSLDITVNTLDLYPEAKENDPQKLYTSGSANYVGYAAFTATVATYLINMYELGKEWEAKPKKGKLYLLGDNKSKKALDGWFKDHDFVVFRNKNTKEEIYIDPSAYESYGVKRVDKLQK